MDITNTTTRAVYVVAVNGFEAQLEATKHLPDYAVALIVLVSFLVLCALLQMCALAVLSPCYFGWRKFQRLNEEREPELELADEPHAQGGRMAPIEERGEERGEV